MTRLGFETLTYQNNRMMKKETKQQNSTDTQMGYDTVLAPVIVRWIPLTEKEPEEGFEVLLYNKNWINEDWNPKGIRIGYLDGVGGWISAYWCNYHDDYHTRTSDEDNKQFEDYKAENQVPTHWMEIPPCVG